MQQLRASSSELLEPWEVGYWAEKQRLASFDFDEEACAPISPSTASSAACTRSRNDFRIKHPRTFEARGSRSLARKSSSTSSTTARAANSSEPSTDWHPRESKRGGAWMISLITGNRDQSAGPRTPPRSHLWQPHTVRERSTPAHPPRGRNHFHELAPAPPPLR